MSEETILDKLKSEHKDYLNQLYFSLLNVANLFCSDETDKKMAAMFRLGLVISELSCFYDVEDDEDENDSD